MFSQNKVPKVDVNTMEPASWPENPSKEWCPPGHGDLYAALSGSGKLDEVRQPPRSPLPPLLMMSLFWVPRRWKWWWWW